MKRKWLLATFITVFTLTGCSISIGEQASSTNSSQNVPSNSQDATQNSGEDRQQAPNAIDSTQSGSDEVGQTKTVGDLTITINSVRESTGNDTSQTKNEKYVILDATVTNNGDNPIGLYGDNVVLEDQNGRRVEAQYSPYGVTEVNYVTTTIPARTKITRGVFVFDTFASSTYILTIRQGDSSATWNIQP